MATVTPSNTNSVGGDDSTFLLTWNLTTANLDGAPVERPQWPDRVLTVSGTFGGATIVLQGSNDGTNWATCKDVNGNAVSLTAAGIFHVTGTPRFMRPFLSVAGAGAAIAVQLLCRRASDLRV